jgi:hypothetical protein
VGDPLVPTGNVFSVEVGRLYRWSVTEGTARLGSVAQFGPVGVSAFAKPDPTITGIGLEVRPYLGGLSLISGVPIFSHRTNSAASGRRVGTIAIGEGAQANGAVFWSIGIGEQAQAAGAASTAIAIGQTAQLRASSVASVAIGLAAQQNVSGNSAIAIGNQAQSSGSGHSSIAIGPLSQSLASGDRAIGIGTQVQYRWDTSIATSPTLHDLTSFPLKAGSLYQIKGSGVVIDGAATANNAIYRATGSETSITATSGLQVIPATPSGNDSIAIGTSSAATVNDAIAIGRDVVSTDASVVKIGRAGTATRLMVGSNEMLSIPALKALAASATDFADFKTKIAAL